MSVCTGCKEFFLKTEDDWSLSLKLNFPCPVCLRLAKILDEGPKKSAFFCRKNCFTAHHTGLRHRKKHYLPILALPLDVRPIIVRYFTRNDWKTLACVSRNFIWNVKHETLKSLHEKYLAELERLRLENENNIIEEEVVVPPPPEPEPAPVPVPDPEPDFVII